MKKILLLVTLFFISNSFGQFNSDREAYLSLLDKLKKDPNKIYENVTSTSETTDFVNFKTVNGEEKLITLKIYKLFNDVSTPSTESKTIDLTPELKQFNLAESLIIAANPRFNTSNLSNIYQINFEKLSHLSNLITFSFDVGPNQKSQLEVFNLDKINTIPQLRTLGLRALKMDDGVYNVLESTTPYNIKDFTISPFTNGVESISNFTFSGFKNTLEKLTIEDFYGNLNNNFLSNLPNLRSFTYIGEFNNFPTNLSNSQKLEEVTLKNKFSDLTIPAQISDLTNLKSLDFKAARIYLPSTLSNLKKLTSIKFQLENTEGLESITTISSLTNLMINFNTTSKKRLDLQQLKNLKQLEYISNTTQFDDADYTLPSNINQLRELERLDITINKSPIEINQLSNLKRLSVRYINSDLFPKIDFSQNTSLEYLIFDNYNEDLKTPRIKFDKEFEKLTNLSYILFYNVPIEMNVTNQFTSLFNATHPNPNVSMLKYLSIYNLETNIPNKIEGVLNICNNHDIMLEIAGTSPQTIDYRNKSLTKDTYFSLDLKDSNNPLIIVDDVNKFKNTFGETYYNSTTQTEVPYNLTTSSEPCERSLSTVNINKSEVKLYPNPTADVLNIETDANKNLIKIIDLSGKVISTYSVQENKISLKVQHLPKGIYIVEIENEKGKTISKFIKK